jgi:hypothetical protein
MGFRAYARGATLRRSKARRRTVTVPSLRRARGYARGVDASDVEKLHKRFFSFEIPTVFAFSLDPTFSTVMTVHAVFEIVHLCDSRIDLENDRKLPTARTG